MVIQLLKRLAFLVILVMTEAQAQKAAEVNYDESKVPPYKLPDVLTTTTRLVVRNKETWEKVRRPEIIKLFDENVYGQMPNSYDRLAYEVKNEQTDAMAGKATLKEVVIEVANQNKSVKINLVLFVPTKPKKLVPVFLLINNRGKENTDPSRRHKSDFWPAELVIDSGYAIAAFHVSDLAPDDSATNYHFSALVC